MLLVASCGGGRERPSTPLDPGAAGIDSGRGVVPGDDAGTHEEPCSELDPRSEPPEVFVAPEGVESLFVDHISAATSTLLVSIYMLSTDAIVGALEDAAARGVSVRVIVDRDQTENLAARDRLAAAGADVRLSPEVFTHYHVKSIVIDGAAAIVFSGNFNDYSMRTERNHGVVLHDADDIADLELLFEEDWNQAISRVDLSCTRLVVSPNNSRERIEGLMRRATGTLRIQHLSFSDDEAREVVRERVAAGVNVRVLLADPGWIEGNAEAATALRALGADVRYFVRLENHAKLIVSDDAAAFVGSENLSWTSLQQNREVGVVLTDAPSIDTLASAFEADWSAATPAP